MRRMHMGVLDDERLHYKLHCISWGTTFGQHFFFLFYFFFF